MMEGIKEDRYIKEKKRRKKILIIAALFAVIMIAWALFDFNFSLKKSERQNNLKFLSEWTEQNAGELQYKMAQYYQILECTADFAKGKDPDSLETQRALNEMFPAEYLPFSFLKVINAQGKVPEEERDYSEELFFTQAIKGRKGLSVDLTEKDGTVILAMPVYDQAGENINAVVCAGLDQKEFDVFTNVKKKRKQDTLDYLEYFVMDAQGNYILKKAFQEISGDNFFERMESHDLTIPVRRIQSRLEVGITVPMQIDSGTSEGTTAVAAAVNGIPVYTVTVVSDRQMEAASNVYEKFVLRMMLKVFAVMAMVGSLYLYFQAGDKRYIRRLNQRLMLNEETYRITARNSDTCVFTYDVDTQLIQFLNDKYKDLGLEQSQLSVPLLLKKIRQINLDAGNAIDGLLRTIAHKEASGSAKFVMQKDMKPRYFEIFTTNLFDDDGNVSRVVGKIENITSSELNIRKLQKKVGFRNTLLSDCMGYMMVDVDTDQILDSSYNVLKQEEPGKYTYTDVLEAYLSKRVRPEYWNDLTLKMGCESLKKLYENRIFRKNYEYQVLGPQGENVWTSCEIRLSQDKNTSDITAYLVYRNIDDTKREQENLEKMARVDVLTTAWNRATGTAKIEECLKTLPSEGCVHIFAIADLDNFKTLNDQFGHMWGDKALYEVVRIMKEHCRHKDVVCRLGGDEFIIFFSDVPREAVQKNLSALSDKFRITYEKHGQKITISASMGVALTDRDDVCFGDLYERADASLYQVKRTCKGGYGIEDF